MGLQIYKSFSVVRVFELTETVNMTLRNSASLTLNYHQKVMLRYIKLFLIKTVTFQFCCNLSSSLSSSILKFSRKFTLMKNICYHYDFTDAYSTTRGQQKKGLSHSYFTNWLIILESLAFTRLLGIPFTKIHHTNCKS